MPLHTEINFEDEICGHLSTAGWLHAQGDAAEYDRKLAMFPADVVAWIRETQPEAWDYVSANHGADAEKVLLERLRDCLNQRGTLDVLRHGFDVPGVRKQIVVAQFKPSLTINPDITARYKANRLRVVRLQSGAAFRPGVP